MVSVSILIVIEVGGRGGYGNLGQKEELRLLRLQYTRIFGTFLSAQIIPSGKTLII